jgi:hypothetical protein
MQNPRSNARVFHMVAHHQKICLAIAALCAHMAAIGFSAGWLGSALLNASASAFFIFPRHR